MPSISPTVGGYSLESEVKTPSRLFSDTGSSFVCSMCSTEKNVTGYLQSNGRKLGLKHISGISIEEVPSGKMSQEIKLNAQLSV